MIRRRTALPFLPLALAIACESPTAVSPRQVASRTEALTSESAPQDATCTDLIIGGTYDDVVVPEGASCILVRATLTGTLTALAGSSLQTSSNEIAGNIEIESAQSVRLSSDVVAGNVIIARSTAAEGTTPDYLVAGLTLTSGDIRVMNNSRINFNLRDNDVLAGNISVVGNENTTFTLIANRVAQNVVVVANRGETSKMVRSTTAGHAIICQNNDQPFVAAVNQAPRLVGQCDVPFVEE